MADEGEIVEKLKSNDPEAFCYMYNTYAPALYGLILKLTQDEEVACGILSRSLVSTCQQINSFDGLKSSFFTWMVCITVKYSKEVLRISHKTAMERLILKPVND